jgi:SAM-dependent methyltransferase
MFFHRKNSKLQKQKIVRGYLRGKNILDIGYAQSPFLFAEGFYGLDIQKRDAPKGYAEVKVADLNSEKIPYPDKKFDTVVALDTIEHLANPLKVFFEINRVLEIGGRFIFSVPNPYFWKEIFLNIFEKNNAKQTDPAHITLLTKHGIKNLFYWTGLELEKTIGFGFPIPFTKYVMSMKEFPTMAYGSIYVAKKIKDEDSFRIITISHSRDLRIFSKM